MTLISYAQNGEDIMLWRALSDVEQGFYVDIGAQDPISHSVTKFFYECGWRGINVEPVAHWFSRLQEDRPEDTNLQILVGSEETEHAFFEVADTGLSTTSAELAESYRAQQRLVDVRHIAMRTLDSILSDHARGPIHFLKIDVEGAESDVLVGLDLKLHRPWILVIEATRPLSSVESHQGWESDVLASGYRLVYRDGLNRFYLANEQSHRAGAFSFPPNVFDGFTSHEQRLGQAAIHERDQWKTRAAQLSEIIEAVQGLADGRGAQLLEIEAEYESLCARTSRPNLRQPGARQLFVDVTMLASTDAKTGVHRVVRNVLRQLLAQPPEGFDVTPVRFAGAGYLHAAQFAAEFSGACNDGQDGPVSPRPGDIILGLDLIADVVPVHIDYFRDLRARGVQLWFVIYDMLPVLRPDCFQPDYRVVFQRWYQALGEIATGVACISRSVADEFKAWLDQLQPARPEPLQLGFFHLGADISEGVVSQPPVRRSPAHPVFLMIGTVEVRKGHAQVLDAFDELWRRGSPAQLIVIGKPGWLADDVVARMRTHDEVGKRLVWKEAATDLELASAYAAASALIMASEGEGFGLPLIEAAQHGLPVIARDLPVFREVAGPGAFYFDSTEPMALAASLERWLSLSNQGVHPDPRDIRWNTWQESAQQLWSLIRDGAQGLWCRGGKFEASAADPRIGTQIGRLDRGKLVSDGREGYLAYGPYSQIPKGDYDVALSLEMLGQGTSRGMVDLVAFDDCEVIHEIDLSECTAAAGSVRIEFPLKLQRDLEQFQVRIRVPANDPVAFVGWQMLPRPLGDVYSRAVTAEFARDSARCQLEKASSEIVTLRTEVARLDAVALGAQEHAAKLSEALRSVQHERGQATTDRDWLLARIHELESSRSWKVTRPLRSAGAFARRVRRLLVVVARAIWHRVVKHRVASSLALALSSPLPPLRRRLERSIAAHSASAAQAANLSVGPRPPIVIGPAASGVLVKLEEARKQAAGSNE